MTATLTMRIALVYILLLSTIVCLGIKVKVTRVIDGDTFETENGEKVRLIGINAPEISDIFGIEAKHYLSNLIENKIVEIQSDIVSNDRDIYQRLLRYVIIDGIDINNKMVSDGFAFAFLKFPFSRLDDYKQSQIAAMEEKKVIWGVNSKETIREKQDEKRSNLFVNFSSKVYFVGAAILLLLFVGFYNYFKK